MNKTRSNPKGESVAHRLRRQRRAAIEFAIELSRIESEADLTESQVLKILAEFFEHDLLFPYAVGASVEAAEAMCLLAPAMCADRTWLNGAIVIATMLLAATVGRKEWEFPIPESVVRYKGGAPRNKAFLVTPPETDATEFFAKRFGFFLIQHLGSDEGQMVRMCARREDCGLFFLANRPKQEYCSRKCTNAVAFEHHVERQKKTLGEEAYRARRAKAVRTSATARRAHQDSPPPPSRKALAVDADT